METNSQIALLYSTVDGQTRKISETMASHLMEMGRHVHLFPIEDFKEDPGNFEVLIIGASVRYGRHNETTYNYIAAHKDKLKQMNTVFFSVNLVARNSNKNTPETNPYFLKFVEEVQWQPRLAAVFAGKLDYKKYNFRDKLMIKLIMLITKGPLWTPAPLEYTDWQSVKEFSRKIGNLRPIRTSA